MRVRTLPEVLRVLYNYRFFVYVDYSVVFHFFYFPHHRASVYRKIIGDLRKGDGKLNFGRLLSFRKTGKIGEQLVSHGFLTENFGVRRHSFASAEYRREQVVDKGYVTRTFIAAGLHQFSRVEKRHFAVLHCRNDKTASVRFRKKKISAENVARFVYFRDRHIEVQYC